MGNLGIGTGISIIFYLVLALLMPFVNLYRWALRRRSYSRAFVLRHFAYGMLIVAMVVFVIRLMLANSGLAPSNYTSPVFKYGSTFAVSLVVFWTVVPLLLAIWFKVFQNPAFKYRKASRPRVITMADLRRKRGWRYVAPMRSS